MLASAPQGFEPCHVPIDNRPCHGKANSSRPDALGAPHATSGARRVVTRFIALTSGGEERTPKAAIRRPAAAPVALIVTFAVIRNVAPSTPSRATPPAMVRPPRMGFMAST